MTSEFFTPEDSSTGGLGTYIWNQAKLLSENGVEVVIYQPSYKRNETFYLNNRIRFVQFVCPAFRLSLFERISHFFLRQIKGFSYSHYLKLKHNAKFIQEFLKKELEVDPVDLIQYSNLNGLGLYSITSIPNIIRISSLTVLYSELGKGYYGIRPDLVRAQIEIESETYQSAKYIVGPSSYMLSKLLTYGSQHKYRLPTPIEINNNSKPLGKSILSNRVGFFGSVDYRKGVDLLIDAISNVQILELELFICGRLNDDSDENSTIKSRVISEKFIHYSDSLPKQQLFELMGDMDVIILPSRVDNFPNTLLESMAMGKIVIGPNAWGFEEVIEHGVNGLLFECGNLNSLVRVIENFFSMSQKERILMEEKAFHSAQNYAGSKVFNEILDVYQQCIDHHDSLCAESLD